MVVWPDFLAWDDTTRRSSAGHRVRGSTRRTTGWHKTLSNVGVNGVSGISADVSWDLQDPATDAGFLNEQDVTTLVNRNGFRFWGSRTCSDDPLFAFENYTRTAQVIADSIAEAQMAIIDGRSTRRCRATSSKRSTPSSANGSRRAT